VYVLIWKVWSGRYLVIGILNVADLNGKLPFVMIKVLVDLWGSVGIDGSYNCRSEQCDWSSEEKQASCRCGMHLRTFLCRPLQNNDKNLPHLRVWANESESYLNSIWFSGVHFRAHLHGTIFVSCDNLTTGLRHDLRLVCTPEKCRSILKHDLKRCSSRKSCRGPAACDGNRNV